jgi:hypothetical protein
MECEEELCFECAEYHTKLKMARNHHVVDLKLKTSYSALLKKSNQATSYIPFLGQIQKMFN